MRDWIAELSNQLLGRIENQLLRHGIEIYAATPSVLRGVSLGTPVAGDVAPREGESLLFD